MRHIFEKMNVSLFPAEVSDYFYNFLKKVKSDRKKNEHKVKCIATMDLMLVVVFCI